METSNKYYTPTIEEFYVGFKYEEQYNESAPFLPDVVEACQYAYPDYDLLGHLAWKCEKKEVRVKYLDKEDIISLGWRYNPALDQITIQGKSGNLYMIKHTAENKIAIMYPGSDVFLFYGYIKNKSELRVLMKQLNII